MRARAATALLLLAGCVITLRDPATQEPEATPAPAAGAQPSTAATGPAATPGADGTTTPVAAASTTPGATTPGATTPGATTPGATTPGATTPGGTTPGSTSPGTTTPGATSPGATSPGAPMITSSPTTPTSALTGPETVEERMISRTVGQADGVLVFWPRIIPREIVDQNRELGGALQRHIRGVVERALPGRPIDFRPEPERVCKKGGCDAVTVGILLSRDNQGCLVVALVARPGESPTKIVPWAGKVALRQDTIPFREYPEGQISVVDYVPCTALLTTMDQNESAVIAALRDAAK